MILYLLISKSPQITVWFILIDYILSLRCLDILGLSLCYFLLGYAWKYWELFQLFFNSHFGCAFLYYWNNIAHPVQEGSRPIEVPKGYFDRRSSQTIFLKFHSACWFDVFRYYWCAKVTIFLTRWETVCIYSKECNVLCDHRHQIVMKKLSSFYYFQWCHKLQVDVLCKGSRCQVVILTMLMKGQHKCGAITLIMVIDKVSEKPA